MSRNIPTDFRARLTDDDDGSILVETDDLDEAHEVAEEASDSHNVVVEYLSLVTGQWETLTEYVEGHVL